MADPIFINSSFRTSSTWLWEKLRKLENVTAYCEFFNTQLSGLSLRKIQDATYASWDSKHPPCAPYFFEFLPLLRPEGGVVGYAPEMGLDRFIPANGIDGNLSEEEQRYVAALIEHSRAAGMVPVLSETRTLGRARALKAAFGGKTLLVYRNLFHQWGSYCYQDAMGNPTFIGTIQETLAASRHDPFLKALGEWYRVAERGRDDEALFAAFLLLHLYLYAFSFDVSDLIVDTNAIARDPQTRAATEDALSDMVGGRVDLSDARESFQFSAVRIGSVAVFIDTIDQFAKLIATDARVSPQAVAFLYRAKDEALAEMDRHAFYTNGARAVQVRRLDEIRQSVATERNTLSARLQAAEVECARLRAALVAGGSGMDRQ